MISPSEAEAAIVKHAPAMPQELRSLNNLSGCILKQTVIAERDQPPFDRVAMDGIALASAAWNSGTRKFQLAGTQAAGAAPLQLTETSSCIEVMTGAMLPEGCDCVVPVEQVVIRDGLAEIAPEAKVILGLHIHRRAADGTSGQTLLQPGTVLHAPEIAVIASAGLTHVSVSGEPRIAVISTGDELVEPGAPIAAWQIRRSNVYAVLASLQRHGYTQLSNHHIVDEETTLREQLRAHLETHDVLILSGGVSMGKFDFVPKILAELGVQQIFHKIAQRPGKPMWFGVHNTGKAIYALPGNPVSTLACMARYVLPGLAASRGSVIDTQHVRLAQSQSLQKLWTLLPVKLQRHGAEIVAQPQPTGGSGDFIALLGSDGLVELPPGLAPIAAQSLVTFYPW